MKKRNQLLSLVLTAVLLLALAVPTLAAEVKDSATVGDYKNITITSGNADTDTVTEVTATGGAIPPGMSLGKSGAVSCLAGTPTLAGNYQVSGTTSYKDSTHTWTESWTLMVAVSDGKTAAPSDPTPTPGGTTPTATPTASAATGAPVITKQPTSETIDEGGAATFIANATGWAWCAWRFVSADGKTEVIFDVAAEKFPGLQTSGGNWTTLVISNVPASMDGWKVVCLFSSADNRWTYTDGECVIHVKSSATPTPSPTPEPTATPTPSPTPTPEPTATPTPEPTATPTPSSTPESTATPAPSSTPEPEEEVQSVPAALILGIAAVALIAIIIAVVAVSRKQKEKERAARRARRAARRHENQDQNEE